MATFHVDNDALRQRLQAHIAATSRKRDVPRIFEIVYNRQKQPTRNPVTRLEYQKMLHVWGADCPDSGDFQASVILQNGVVFNTMEELKEHFEELGKLEGPFYLDEK